MPNWTINVITLAGDEANLNAFEEAVNGPHGPFDFNKLVPMPAASDEFYADGPLGEAEEQRFGTHNWYDWSLEHWGTKWNASGIDVTRYGTTLEYRFQTAWDAPRGLVGPIKQLAEKLGLALGWEAYHEDDGDETLAKPNAPSIARKGSR